MRYYAKKQILNSDNLPQIAWDAIEPIWDVFPIGSGFNEISRFMNELTKGQSALISLDWCQKITRNDGLSGLLLSPIGNLVPWAIEGFQMIGAIRYAEVFAAASSKLGSEYPISASARKKAYKTLSQEDKDEIKKLEVVFFKLINSEKYDLEIYRGNFVKNNPQEFIKM